MLANVLHLHICCVDVHTIDVSVAGFRFASYKNGMNLGCERFTFPATAMPNELTNSMLLLNKRQLRLWQLDSKSHRWKARFVAFPSSVTHLIAHVGLTINELVQVRKVEQQRRRIRISMTWSVSIQNESIKSQIKMNQSFPRCCIHQQTASSQLLVLRLSSVLTLHNCFWKYSWHGYFWDSHGGV